MLLIGSQALKHHYPNLEREPKDFDIICTHNEFKTWLDIQKNIQTVYSLNRASKFIVMLGPALSCTSIFEFEIAWENTTAKNLIELVNEDSKTEGLYIDENLEFDVPSLDILYTLKMSHRFKKNSHHFLKTMEDIILLRKLGASLPTKYLDWFKSRENETYNYQHPKLNQSKSNFFNPNEGINYIYDHDSIHEIMAQSDKPAYKYFKPDENEVNCSRLMFEKLPHNIKLYSVLEESYVLALERSQIPFKDKVDPKKSFLIALEKVCTSITSGWWREFAYEHYFEVLNMYEENYVFKFWTAVSKGQVKLYDNTSTTMANNI